MDTDATLKPWHYYRMLAGAFLCYLGMVMPMSSISLYVTDGWGMSNLAAGAAAGAAFFTTIFCRKPAGDRADRLGGKRCFLQGSLWYAGGGFFCLFAAWPGLPLELRLAALVAGRMILGIGESLTNVSMACWIVGLQGADKAGRIFATLGMAVYGAAAVGGRAGFYLYQNHGFFGLILASSCAPLLAFFLTRGCPEAEPGGCAPTEKPSLGEVMGRIWRLGLPSGLIAVGFAVVGAFLSKTFVARGWEYAGWGFTLCGCGFVVMRVFIGHLPDKIGGLRVAALSAAVETAGLSLLFLADGPVTGLAGALLTGAGVSMVFPSNAMEITRVVPGRMRGSALSSYNIFLDAAYGFSAPFAGMLADRWGDGASYLFAALSSALGLALILCNIARAKRMAPGNR